MQPRLILYLGRDPGTPGADRLRALDRPGVHDGCSVSVRAVRPSCTQARQGARQRVRDRAAERGKWQPHRAPVPGVRQVMRARHRPL